MTLSFELDPPLTADLRAEILALLAVDTGGVPPEPNPDLGKAP